MLYQSDASQGKVGTRLEYQKDRQPSQIHDIWLDLTSLNVL